MRRTLAAVRPTGFDDIIALVSLYRPGPMNNIPAFGERKNGRARSNIRILARDGARGHLRHLRLPGAGDEAAKVLAGFSLGEADSAPGDGQEDQVRDGCQREGFVAGCEG